MFNYLNFWFKSTNQHGVHSPFVYSYLTKGIYESEKLSTNKQTNWILKSVQYFNTHKIYIKNLPESNLSEIHKKLITESFYEAKLILYHGNDFEELNEIIYEMNSEQLLILSFSKYDVKLLNKIRKDEQVTLVLDFYIGCLISKSDKQPKQNFFLRM